MRLRHKDEIYRPNVTVKKVKNGIPTVVEISGETYILVHNNQVGGQQKKKKRHNDNRNHLKGMKK